MAGIETIAKGDSSRIVEARRFLVRDAQELTAVWAAHAGPDAPVPTIDFETRMVAAVFAGERPQPGYDITITGTQHKGNVLVVVVEEQPPEAGFVAAQILISPFHVVTLDREEGEVRFAAADPEKTRTLIFKPQPAALGPEDPEDTVPAPRPGIRAPRSAINDTGSTIQRLPAHVARTTDSSSSSTSSTGLTPTVAAAMAYLAGPFSGLLMLSTERTSGFVRFHAWQALLGLGVLGTAAVFFLVSAFVLLIVSPTAFWVMLWLAAIASAVWVVVWGLCLWNAYQGNVWKLPYAGDYAERHAKIA